MDICPLGLFINGKTRFSLAYFFMLLNNNEKFLTIDIFRANISEINLHKDDKI